MAHHKTSVRKHNPPAQIFALVLIGAGLLAIGIAALVLLPKPASSGEDERSVTPLEVAFDAPSLALVDLDGQAVSLADYQGQVILVNNWATWCPPCKAEMPTLQAYYEAHQNEGFTIIAIEAGEPAAEVAGFVDEYQLTFPVWPDPEGKALNAFRNQALPNSYVIDRSGTVRLAWTGAINRTMLEKYVTPLLED